MMDTFGILAAAVPSVISACVFAVAKKIGSDMKDVKEKTDANNNATFVMLQNTILQSCKRHQKHGYIPSHEAEMLQSLFDQYVAMHGNGYVKKQVERTLMLPQESDEE